MTRHRLATLAAAATLYVLPPAFGAEIGDSPWMGAAFEGSAKELELFARNGGQIVRLYKKEDAWVLDEAAKLGLKVVMGLWLGHPRQGFDLNDPVAIESQNTDIRDFVTQYRHHPALLAWGVGNEVEILQADPRPAWTLVNKTAAMIKAIDPDHPTIMVVANTGDDHLKTLATHSAEVDIIGMNVYAGGLYDLPQRLKKAGITKPVMITELGPLGQWDAPKKPWGAPMELTGSQKAAFFSKAMAFIKEDPQLSGGFAFLWGSKQEQTETWHGLILKDGSLTPMTDALAESWGHPITNRAPAIQGTTMNADIHNPGAEIIAFVEAMDPEGESLATEWAVRREASDLKKAGDPESIPERIEVAIKSNNTHTLRFEAPAPGAYRLFVTVRDSSGKADTANIPFLVSGSETN